MGTQQTGRKRWDGDGTRTPPPGFEPVAPGLGLCMETQHCNPAGVCAGGMLAAVMDRALGGAVMYAARRGAPLPTVSLSSEFIAPGRPGESLETETLSVRPKGDRGSASIVMPGPEGVVVQGTGICKRSGRGGG
jgi:acyl-coenzyme A thioesterase PaaI-like protein